MYSRVTLKGTKPEAPAPLPESLLGLADSSLADLSAALNPVPSDLRGIGYWPATIVQPEFNPIEFATTEEFELVADKASKTVTAKPKLRALTPAEAEAALEEINPVPLEMGKLWLIKAMRQIGIKDDFDLLMAEASEETIEEWEASYNIRITHPLVIHFATALGKDDAYLRSLYRLASTIRAAEV